MATNPDYADLLRAFTDEQVEFLIVGAYAVIFHAEPRYTKDLDVWVRATEENAGRVLRALGRFGAPLSGVCRADFENEELVFQIGVEPNRVDVLMGITGLDFDTAWSGKVASSYGGVPVFILGRPELIKAKRAAGRPQDLLDVARLEQAPDGS